MCPLLLSMVDIESILQRFGVPYITHGPNVKKGELNICCPWCGDDPSFHMGISPETGWWACWRDRDHRGKSLRRLFGKLLRLGPNELDGLLGKRQVTAVDEMLKTFRALQAKPKETKPGPVPLPAEFTPIRQTTGPRQQVWEYLADRGYSKRDIDDVVDLYGLCCTASGRFARRVIFPIKLRGEVVAWTGRDITGNHPARYLTEDNGHGKALLLYSKLRVPHVVAVEGPFDWLRLNLAAYRYNLPVRALAVLGTAVVGAQINLLAKLLPRTTRLHVAFDANATAVGHALLSDLAPFSPLPAPLPPGPEDPGAMTLRQARDFLLQIQKS